MLLMIFGGVVLVGFLVMFLGRGARAQGQVAPKNDVTTRDPAADEPTPGASSVAPKAVAENAQRHVPPA